MWLRFVSSFPPHCRTEATASRLPRCHATQVVSRERDDRFVTARESRECGFRRHFRESSRAMNFAPIVLALLFANAPQPQPLPVAELSNPAADATRSVTGLYSKQLAPGTGKATPNEDSFVKIRYSIWSSEGKLIDAI